MADPSPSGVLNHHEFAAPSAAVVAVTIAVKRDANDRLLDPVLGGDRRDMRSMVLNAKYR